jgi:predicted DNA-binding transcriptional regulator AlpA
MAVKSPDAPTNALNQGHKIEILGVEEVANRLGIPVSSVYEKTRFRGSNGPTPLPHRKLGRYIKVIASELDAWLLALPHASPARKRKYVRKSKKGA